jgi:AcrR family transcriptional regulator
MVDIAVRGGVAKATLYNHFRTKDEVISALVQAEADEIFKDALTVQDDAAKSLARAAWRLSTNTVLRGAVRAEPALTAAIIASYPTGTLWSHFDELVGQWLIAVGLRDEESGRDLLLRWLATTSLMPASTSQEVGAQALFAQATLLVSCLKSAPCD